MLLNKVNKCVKAAVSDDQQPWATSSNYIKAKNLYKMGYYWMIATVFFISKFRISDNFFITYNLIYIF